MFESEKQNLIDNWVAETLERKKRIRKLYQLLCDESDAAVLQMKLLGMSGAQIHAHAMKASARNIGALVALIAGQNRKKYDAARGDADAKVPSAKE